MNLPVWAEGFVPSINSVKLRDAFLDFLLPETHENIAVLENRSIGGLDEVVCPKPPHSTVAYAVPETDKIVVLFVLVEVCDFVEFALYHEKITAKLRFRAL